MQPQRSRTPRHRVLLAGFGVAVVAFGATQVAADRRAAAPSSPPLPMALVESVLSETPTVSADGRWVAYSGLREVKIADPADPTRQATTVVHENTIWLKDRADNSATDLTPVRSELRAGNTVWPVISADGCTVTVITELALDLFRDDDLGDRWDVYRLLLPHCDGEVDDWELVSATQGSGFDATAGDDVDPRYPPAVSADGNRVAYTRKFAPQAGDISGVTVVDLTIALGEAGRSIPVAGTPTAPPSSTFRYRGQREPAISADGAVLAFTSDAVSDAAQPIWGVGVTEGGFAISNVYVWDLTSGSVSAVSEIAAGATGDASSPALSGNGRYVAFVSRASNLVPGATLPPCSDVCLPQVYLFDRSDSSLRLASRVPGDPTSPGVAADAGATQPALNFAGDELLYVTRSNNLFPTRSLGVGDADDGDIVLALPALGVAHRVSVLADGVSPAPAANSRPRLSATGRVIVFDTLAGAVFPESSGGVDGSRETGRQVAVVAHAPTLALADLDVGTVAVFFPGPEWFLVLSNSGPSAFQPSTATVDNDDFLITGGSCLEKAEPLPAGGSCTIKLMLLPSQAGERSATLTVSEEGFGAVSITAQLSGRGGEPALMPTPAGGYAGSVMVGATSTEPLAFEIGNVAFTSVKIASVNVRGTHADDFVVSADECSRETLGQGATSCAVEVTFAPTAGGRRSAQVVVATRDGAYTTMLLSGDAYYEPRLSVSRQSIMAGSRVQVTGTGFAAAAKVTISWADGSGGSVATLTDATGTFVTDMVVRATDRVGERQLVAQSLTETGAQTAAVDVVIASPMNRQGPNSPAWPGR